MIEDPRSAYWESISPEAARIKNKVKCNNNDKDDPKNFIYMSRLLHDFFDGLNAKPPRFPTIKIRYNRHDKEKVPCPSIGNEPVELGMPLRQRVVVHIIFKNADVYSFLMRFIRGGTEINANTYEVDMWAWTAIKQGLSATEFLLAEGSKKVYREGCQKESI